MNMRIVCPFFLVIVQFTLYLVLAHSHCLGEDPAPIKNAVENGSLEGELDPATALPAGWIVTQRPPNGYAITVVEGGRTGKKCLQIRGEGGNVQIRIKPLTMTPEHRSVISGWIKGAGGTGVVSLMHRYHDANGRRINSTSIGGVGSSKNEWTQTAMTALPELTEPGASAEFIINANGKVDALVDDLEELTLDTTPNDLMWAAGDFESHYNGQLQLLNKTATSPAGTLEAALHDKHPANGRYCLRMRGIADWATTTMRSLEYDSGKVYTLSGKVRVNSGRATIRIDFYKGEDRSNLLGSKTIDATESKDWQTLSVDTRDSNYPDATHITATAVCYGDTEAFFDQLVILAN